VQGIDGFLLEEMVCACWKHNQGEVFAPRSSRWCTDILCLIGLAVAVILQIVLAVASVNEEPGLLDNILYPEDSYGNNCGKSGTATASMPKVFFPELDQDIIDQWGILSTGQYWKFKPTRVRASSCPDGFSLKSPVKYGGASYPSHGGPNKTLASFYYTFVTSDIIDRCFPMDTTNSIGYTELCSVPSCTNATLNLTLSGSVNCHRVAAQPDADNVWQVCVAGTSSALCAAQRSACELLVRQESKDEFAPTSQTDKSQEMTETISSWVKMTLGAFEGLLDSKGFSTIVVLGFAMPLLSGFIWAGLLYMFAGTIILVTLLTLMVTLIILSAYLGSKAGWYDAHPSSICPATTRCCRRPRATCRPGTRSQRRSRASSP
jgi:choline transporter-like protein 2/4/5